ncbi:MAG: carboxypeptidase-like regulatory domain-containing protein [Bacteroidales bacterium]|nr:carboxypeptidase-like regulatory domain-containing protein [Bacteroidales bacterium]
MKYLYTLLFTLFLSTFTYGNVISISGIVINNEQQGLQYVSIGIINKTIGTVSNENGEFSLKIKESQLSPNDSIRFSMIGYYSKSFLTSEILDVKSLTIILTEKIETIPEAIITGNKLKTKLENINFFIYSNHDTVTIRINIYSVKRRKPHISLLHTGIYTEITGKHDWVYVNLKQYNIIVNEDIIVALEWVNKSKKGDYLFFPLARPSVASHYYKHGSQNKWERWPHMSSLMKLTLKY